MLPIKRNMREAVICQLQCCWQLFYMVDSGVSHFKAPDYLLFYQGQLIHYNIMIHYINKK